jgi:hypothetical protein
VLHRWGRKRNQAGGDSHLIGGMHACMHMACYVLLRVSEKQLCTQACMAGVLIPHSQPFLHFCAAAPAAVVSDHPCLRRVLRSSQQWPDPLPLATLANRSLRDHLRSQTPSAWKAALAPYPAAENVSARGRVKTVDHVRLLP